MTITKVKEVRGTKPRPFLSGWHVQNVPSSGMSFRPPSPLQLTRGAPLFSRIVWDDLQTISAKCVVPLSRYFRGIKSSSFIRLPNGKPINSRKALERWLTATRYIVESQSLDVRAIECDLAVLCMNYLTLRCFRKGLKDQEIQVAIQNAEYAFQDYAVSKWNEHLQSILDSKNSTLFNDPVKGALYQYKISQTLRRFKETFKSGLAIPNDEQTRQLLDPEIPRGDCQAFQGYDFYQVLVDIWTHVHRHQKLPAKDRNKISIKELGDAIEKIRNKLEGLSEGSTPESDMGRMLTDRYGTKIFKCDRVRCVYFHEGFDEKEQRDRHLPRHDRPFLCPIEGCSLVPFGFSTNKDKEKHVKNYHSEELELPAQFRQLGREVPKDAKFQCDLCPKAFTRLANLEGHKNSHLGRRPYACTTCGKAFARANDRRRHEKKHVRRV